MQLASPSPPHPYEGELTILTNWYEAVAVVAAMTCEPTVAGALDVTPNLDPSPGDVDLGEPTGAQFVQSSSGMLPVAVRIRAPSGHRLVNFQLVASYSLDHLTSSNDAASGGAAAYAEAEWAGVEATLNDPPGGFQLVASDTQSAHRGLVAVGTV